jgi:rsbT co-antagonist protein RsbR
MPHETESKIPEILREYEDEILDEWIEEQLRATTLRADLMKEAELRDQSGSFIKRFGEAASGGNLRDIQRPNWDPVREVLENVTKSRVRRGFNPSETAKFIFSFKQPLFARLRESHDNRDKLAEDYWTASILLDQLGLYTTEVYQEAREQIIDRQQKEMFELSAPVVELWNDILAIPLIGTLDSKRTQVVMETLLSRIAETKAEVAIIDITGVPTVDTLTAQHIQKTVAAARLMGAECLISGIRPQIAQTMVSVGIDFGTTVTKATMASALAIALEKRGLTVQPVRPTGRSAGQPGAGEL